MRQNGRSHFVANPAVDGDFAENRHFSPWQGEMPNRRANPREYA
jgi:hypothetical protein